MKKISRKAIISIVILLLILLGVYRTLNVSKEIKRTNYLMGTIVNITLFEQDDKVFQKCFDIVRDIEKKMSLNIQNSEVNRINEKAYTEPVKLSDDMYTVIEKSLEYSKLSSGKFDITAGKLVQLWNIGTESAHVPTQEEIEESKSYVDYRNIELNEKDKTIKFKKDGIVLDLGAIAKGYAADKVRDYLLSEKIDKAIIDLGGNIFVVGTNPENKPWKIGIQNPFTDNRNSYLGSISESNMSIVTSGVYERYFEENNKKYHHILDTATGYPTESDLMGVSIISKNSIDGDALSTSVFALGLKEGMNLIDKVEGVDAIFVTKDKKVYLSQNIKGTFKVHDAAFSVMNK